MDARYAYLKIEQNRAILRLVCRTWKILLDDFDDLLRISHLRNGDWPRRPTNRQNKVAYYILEERRLCGMRRIVEAHHSSPAKYRAGYYEDEKLCIGIEFPLARITTILNQDILISPSYDLAQPILALRWWSGQSADPLTTLLHPVFSSLLALSLTIDYPTTHLYGCQDFILPELRYLELILRKKWTLPREKAEMTISTWRFPKLTLLRVNAITEQDAKDELLGLVRAHAHQIEELHASMYDAQFPTPQDWQSFRSLRLIVFDSLNLMADGLSSANVRWNTTRPGISDASNVAHRRLTMSLQYPPTENELISSILPKFDACQSILPNIDFAVTTTWQAIREKIEANHFYHDMVALHGLRDTFMVAEKLGIDIVDPDGYGLYSDRARNVRSLVQDIISDGITAELFT
ncbi:SubName: Full=Uncharacterized protein {ECO:0000313/EMBL:CCA73809.1} [Serendipita indica DSM 11827]|uniref:F-box domain-containing protein n=1 Tax=Serendipita indica (strain DSM 11827) TaxID=1109443 RepID=G4TR66_SERID|nr:SubName: Full=Uncharacterized protein {ECO:0000313/EMBL:CCA73809.1} [Serendipita indica DSM 11827]CCA73809.1 hypothetical protein PIIN_07763 [Serendipita indica DSM 11827]